MFKYDGFEYFKGPKPLKSTFPGSSLKNLNDIKQTDWEYTEGKYYTEEAAEKRIDNMYETLEKLLSKTMAPGKAWEAHDPTPSSPPKFEPDIKPGDGSRWDDL